MYYLIDKLIISSEHQKLLARKKEKNIEKCKPDFLWARWVVYIKIASEYSLRNQLIKLNLPVYLNHKLLSYKKKER